jgi:hypothetical protein
VDFWPRALATLLHSLLEEHEQHPKENTVPPVVRHLHAGDKKAMVTLGHAISEDPGMKLCADWLKTFITDLPVEWIPAGEPFNSR